MAGRSAPSGDPPDGSRCPGWMLREDELGQTIALQMRVRSTEDDISANGSEAERRLPADPFVIANAVILALGTNDARKVDASKEARGSRYILRTNSKSICEKLKQIRELPDHTPVEVIEHPSLNVVHGVLFDSDTIDKSEDYILQNMEGQGVCGVRRIKKRSGNRLINTPLLVITFRGSVLPQLVYFGLIRVNIRQYYPTPMLCYRCANYGHARKHCDEKKYQLICMNCSGMHDMIEGQPCEAPAFCKNCEGDHSPKSKECPMYREEEAIIRLKTNRGLTYAEARSEFRESHRGPSYSCVTKSRLRTETDEKDRTIALLRKEIDTLKEMITALQAQIVNNNQLFRSRSSSVSANESIENVSISTEEPSAEQETYCSSALGTRPKAFHSSIEKMTTRSMTKSRTNGIEFEKNYTDSTKSNKRKGNDCKKDSSPDSPERKKGTRPKNADKLSHSKRR